MDTSNEMQDSVLQGSEHVIGGSKRQALLNPLCIAAPVPPLLPPLLQLRVHRAAAATRGGLLYSGFYCTRHSDRDCALLSALAALASRLQQRPSHEDRSRQGSSMRGGRRHALCHSPRVTCVGLPPLPPISCNLTAAAALAMVAKDPCHMGQRCV
ncbi:hypothetical protein JKP88DRAFT_264341 [Tribonema minus]|uniref:Uncharacterized protein n=1 Tax=Tribonema minus TaxID=303371 RepID=A0A836CBF5_9STRA|nr:hypothetical protein JKP88DRAFT_264341 [Tribonema minus]